MTGGLKPEMVRLIAGHVFLQACMAGTRMAAPLLALRDGHSEASVGVLLALFALTQVFLALPAGRFADRHGLHRPMAWAVVAAGTGAALAVAFPVFPVLCVCVLLTGGATGAATLALQRHVGRVVVLLFLLLLAVFLLVFWLVVLQSGDLDGESHDIVERCYQSIKQGHDQMSQLKHGMEAGNS